MDSYTFAALGLVIILAIGWASGKVAAWCGCKWPVPEWEDTEE